MLADDTPVSVRPGRWQAMGTLNAVPQRKAKFPSPRQNKVLMDSGLETERYAHIHLWFCLNWASVSLVHAFRVSWSSSLCQENTELWNYSQSLAHRGFPPHLLHWAFWSRVVDLAIPFGVEESQVYFALTDGQSWVY